MAHSFYSRGEFTIDGESGTMAQLEGRFSFITQIDKYNLGLDKRKINFRELNGREKEYQKFLFYKYFLGIHAPLIVTEGKTDIIYMRSALKNLYEKYPRLITRNTESYSSDSFNTNPARLSPFDAIFLSLILFNDAVDRKSVV